MAVRIIVEDPRGYYLRRAGRSAIGFAGALLVAAGSITTFPLCLLGVTTLATDTSAAGLPAPTIPGGFAASVIWFVLALTAWLVGVRLARRRRRLVLFLRRFGYVDATQAASFATRGIGGSWRLVTLDDAQIAAVGVEGTSGRTARATARGAHTFNRFQQVGGRIWATGMLVGMIGLGAVVAITYLQQPDGDLLSRLVELYESNGPLALLLKAALAVLAVGTILAGVVAGVLITIFPLLLPVFFFASSILQTVRDADATKARQIDHQYAVSTAAADIEQQSRRFFSPRLVVLRVGGGLWREAVLGIADRAAIALVDVSEPTDQVLWEIEVLQRRRTPRMIYIVHGDRVAGLLAPTGDDPQTPQVRLRKLLDGEAVLAYTTDRRGLRRFTRALRACLEEPAVR